MTVPSLPFSMSDVIAEFGAGSLGTILAAQVGALPRNMSSLAGLSDAVDVVSVNAGANIDFTLSDNTANWPQTVSTNRTAIPSPTDDGNYSYAWARISTDVNRGRPIGGSGDTTATKTFSCFLDGTSTEWSNTETWRITVTDGNGGSVSDDVQVILKSVDSGS